MKQNCIKHVIALLLAVCMMTTILPIPALAASDVPVSPGTGTLPVEYFTSTLYNWDEAAANAATQAADRSTGVQSGKPTISQIQNGNYYLDRAMTQRVTVQSEVTGSSYKYTMPDSQPRYRNLVSYDVDYAETSYFYKVDNNYYPVYVTRKTTTNWGGETITYTIYYSTNEGKSYSQIATTTNGSNRTTDLYTRSGSETRSYWLEYNGEKFEGTVTYTSTGATVNTTLYYAGTGGTQQGKGFYFTNSGNKPADSYIPAFSKWSGNQQNFHFYSGLVEKKLSDSTNAPFNNDNVNAANLFATDGSNSGYASVYQNVQVPFIYDEEGYYTLNSDANAVYFPNGTGADGATMNIADAPAIYNNTNQGLDYATGFVPFNALRNYKNTTGHTSGGNSITGYGLSSGSAVYGFGMVTSVPFQMTDTGKDAKGNDIQFEFSGDDDVWVYIDGVLVLDIGGTHDAIRGTINFATGDVTLNAPGYDNIGDKAVCGSNVTQDNTGKTSCSSGEDAATLSQQNMYDALGTTLAGFAGQGQHTMKIYYMDRGQGRTNCMIKFNLPQKDYISVSKTISEYYTGLSNKIPADVMKDLNSRDFTYTLYKDGAIVPNKNFSRYNANGELIGTGSTDAQGTFTLKNGQTATFRNISLDESQTWHVVETQPSDRWTAGWTAESNVTGATVGNTNDFTSKEVTVDGSETSTDTITFNCTNSYSYVSGLDLDVHDETIVIDYGLPVEVDVLKNDVASGGVKEGVAIKTNGTYGNAEVVGDKIVYRLNKALHAVETVTYTVTARDTTNDQTISKDATLTIIPATSMYYEENFSDMITYSNGAVQWTESGQPYDAYQEADFFGTAEGEAGIIHTYGTDTVYLNNLGDSYGTSKKAVAEGKGAQFEYDFTGTGTAIYGRISPETGYIQVTVTNKDTEEINYIYIDTRVIGDVATEKTLYNIPIFNDSTMDYGNYHVRVYLYKAGTPTSAGGSGAEFYLDGIRVYQPMGVSESDGANGYSTAQSAYAADGEANPAVINIRSMIVGNKGDGKEFITLTDIKNTVVDIMDYDSIGPNEELYLNEGNYTASFALVNWDAKAYKLYLGMKAPSGASATVKVGNVAYQLNNSADCYYDISEAVQVEKRDIVNIDEDGVEQTVTVNVGIVTVTCEAGLASLTNIKATGDEEFLFDISGDDIDIPDSGEDLEGANVLYLTTVEAAMKLLEGKGDVVEEEFTPESVKVSCNFSKGAKKATVQVKASDDVAVVTVNGENADLKIAGRNHMFTMNFTKVTSGTTYEVICYNAAGIASETYTVTAK